VRNDRIRIDPEFDARPEQDQGRRTAWLLVTALVVGAALVGLFIVVPSSPDADDDTIVAASPSPTVVASSTSIPPADTNPSPPPDSLPSALTELGKPLSDAISGFSDQIVMLSTPPERFSVTRWSPSESTPTVVLSMDRLAEHGCSPVGLDVSGNWFARIQRDNTLIVHRVLDSPGESYRSEAIGLNVASVAWHESRPGSVAWISCARSGSGPSTLYALDVADPTSEPVSIRTFQQDCQGGIWLEGWSDDGALITESTDGRSDQTLIGSDGAVVDLGQTSLNLTESPDGQFHTTVPGLNDDAPVVEHASSPDGRFVAAIIDDHWDTEIPKLCVMDAETGALVAEVSEHDSDIVTMAWSTGSRFLVYELWNFETGSGGLEWYDTETNTTTRVPLTEIVDAIKITSSS